MDGYFNVNASPVIFKYTVYRNKYSGGLGLNRFYAFSLCNHFSITLSCSFADKPALKMRRAS